MRNLYFVRHGESELNRQRVFAGQTNTPLTDHGRDEARTAGEQAKSYQFDLLVSSPLSRALETAQIIAKKINYPLEQIIVSDIFKEHDMGELVGKSWDDYKEFDTRIATMETWDHLVARAKAGLEFLNSQPADTILLVGHGAFSEALRTAINPRLKFQKEPENAKLVQLI